VLASGRDRRRLLEHRAAQAVHGVRRLGDEGEKQHGGDGDAGHGDFPIS
jgi:hypothetical protein